MNPYREFKSSLIIYAVGVIGAFLIVGLLVWAMYKYTQPQAIGQNRAAERKKGLAEVQVAEADLLNNYGWVDQSKGIVRVPISVGMELVLKENQNPAAARSNLVARAEKAAAAPPKAPEQPNKYE